LSIIVQVDHFSKYGVDEDEAENEENTAPAGVKKIRTEPIKPPPQKAQLKQQVRLVKIHVNMDFYLIKLLTAFADSTETTLCHPTNSQNS
jgi:hypothetical protein